VIALLLLVAQLAVPNPTLTPGAVRPLTKLQVCSIKWGLDSRHVPLSMKKRVAKAYGVPWTEHSAYVFDHFIPRELAGEDTDLNIWPQPKGESRAKDVVENRLHRDVCKGTITLAEAQRQMTAWGR
jgi:hypothetical protein